MNCTQVRVLSQPNTQSRTMQDEDVAFFLTESVLFSYNCSVLVVLRTENRSATVLEIDRVLFI